jgi:hypothetical protein
VLLERLHHLGEVQQRTTEAIDFIAHNEINFAGLDVGQQALECRSIHVAAGEATIVVALGQASPAFVGLAANKGFGGLALGIQRVELLLQSFLRRLARIDGATHQRQRRGGLLAAGIHAVSFVLLRVLRKNKKPLVWLPVMALATALSEA